MTVTRDFAPKRLAIGQLANSQTTIYTAPSYSSSVDSIACYVKKISIYNTNALAQTVRFWYLPSGGTARRIPPRMTLEQDESGELIGGGDSIILGPGDAIQAATTTAAAVDYILEGVEVTDTTT